MYTTGRGSLGVTMMDIKLHPIIRWNEEASESLVCSICFTSWCEVEVVLTIQEVNFLDI